MSESIPVDNDMLGQLVRPNREHLRDNEPESSPPNSTPPVGAAHIGADPAAAAKGAVQ